MKATQRTEISKLDEETNYLLMEPLLNLLALCFAFFSGRRENSSKISFHASKTSEETQALSLEAKGRKFHLDLSLCANSTVFNSAPLLPFLYLSVELN